MFEIYDTEVIYSWTPREFKNFVKGYQLRKIDNYESLAIQVIFQAKVKGKKRISLKDVFDADKAKKELGKKTSSSSKLHVERYMKAKKAMKKYKP
ncbi:hypothetical protein [Paenisporosarcina cavernae]|uniref:Uncharacterized protein n=1 Tax=Paenisporosarcina cavernae TaxID=2320858 RepID=A0A385YRV1_9BACL|nr:hypothetical protein [Paenisporosarcina cavernae]AYC28727.1 hypothetical protein D3873_02130 [Paenisporosarcina cavernae]